MKQLLPLLFLIISSPILSAQEKVELQGIWKATLGEKDNILTAFYEISENGDAYDVFFSMPFYGDKYLYVPLGKLQQHNDSIVFSSFKGVYKENTRSIEGNMSFFGPSYHVVFIKTDKIDEPEVDTVAPTIAKSLWTFQTAGEIWSSPVVDGETVYIGSDDKYLYAIDEQTGNLNWKYETGGMIRSTPAIQKQTVYFNSDDGYLYAVDKKAGELIWKSGIDKKLFYKRSAPANGPSTWDYTSSSPIIKNNIIFCGSTDSCFYAINATSGKELWKFKTNNIIRTAASADEKSVYVADWDGKLYCFDQKTGNVNWQFDAKMAVHAPPTVYENKVIVGSRYSLIWCLDAASGKELWNYNYWWSWVESGAAIKANKAIIGSSDLKQVVALDITSGKRQWYFRTAGYPWGIPTVDEKAIYIGTLETNDAKRGGFVYAINFETGKMVWKTETGFKESNYLNGVYSQIVVDADKLFFGGTDGKVYAIYKPI